MSPISNLVVQRRAVETGRIRIGRQVATPNGRTRPSKLDAFRFTTGSERVARAIAEHLGGEPRRWETAPIGEQWEVLTPAKEIQVAIPPGDNAVSQWMELWSGGGCARRCDGIRETIGETDCLCPADPKVRAEAASKGRACKPTTRISVIIPDLPGVGVFRLESHGWNAAAELGGAAELIAAARGSGVIVPAVLRLEQRQSKSAGETRNFAVPVLDVLPTLRDLTTLQSGAAGLAASLPPAPGAPAIAAARPAVSAGAPPETRPTARQALTGADDAPPASAQSVAELARTADGPFLARLGRYARQRRWLDEHVEVDGAFEPLVDVLRHRDDQLRRPADPEPPVDEHHPTVFEEPAYPVEDDPTISGAPRHTPGEDPTGKPVDW